MVVSELKGCEAINRGDI